MVRSRRLAGSLVFVPCPAWCFASPVTAGASLRHPVVTKTSCPDKQQEPSSGMQQKGHIDVSRRYAHAVKLQCVISKSLYVFIMSIAGAAPTLSERQLQQLVLHRDQTRD